MSGRSRHTKTLRAPGDMVLPPREAVDPDGRIFPWPCEGCQKPSAPVWLIGERGTKHRLCVFCAVQRARRVATLPPRRSR